MLPDINLLPKYERQSSFSSIIFFIGLVICLLLFAVMLFFYFDTKGDIKAANVDLQRLNEQKTLLEAKLAAHDMEDSGVMFENAVRYAEHHIIPTSYFIDELITLLPENSYLSHYNYSGQIVEIDTQFETMTAAATYVAKLNKSDYVKDVKVNQMDAFEFEPLEDEDFNSIPRYHVRYSIDVKQSKLREGGKADE